MAINMQPHKSNQVGFTLIELMIATSIFSVILLVMSFGAVSIGRVYYKGIKSSNTQSVTRKIADDLAQSIQFSSSKVVTTPTQEEKDKNLRKFDIFCIDGKKYSYILNRQVAVSQAEHVFISEVDPNCNASSPSSLNADGNIASGTTEYSDLIGKSMRLSDIEIYQDTNSSNFVVTVRVASGDDDLIEDAKGVKSNEPGYDSSTARCISGSGSQYCAVSNLYTFVNKRL